VEIKKSREGSGKGKVIPIWRQLYGVIAQGHERAGSKILGEIKDKRDLRRGKEKRAPSEKTP